MEAADHLGGRDLVRAVGAVAGQVVDRRGLEQAGFVVAAEGAHAEVHQDRTFRGTKEILGFLRQVGAEFSYTTEVTGAERVDQTHWVVRIRLQGDSPGGVADLSYRFAMQGELITELIIAS